MSEKKKSRNLDEAKGRLKEAAGALTGDEDMKREGKLDQAAGEAKGKINEAVDSVRDGINSLVGKDKDKD